MHLRLFLLLLTYGLGTPFIFSQEQATTTVPTNDHISSIEVVVGQVKQALESVQTTLVKDQLPPLKEVTLSLQTVASKKGGLTLKLWVLNIGGTYEKDQTQQIDIALAPPPAGAKREVGTSITQELEDAIVSVAQGLQDAGKGSIPLMPTRVDVKLSFTVKGDLNGGPNITIVPITLDFTGDLSKTAIQTLTVSFSEPTPKV